MAKKSVVQSDFFHPDRDVKNFTVRLCPPRKEDRLFCAKTRIHYIGGASFFCGKELNETSHKWEGKCVVCSFCDEYELVLSASQLEEHSMKGFPVKQPMFYRGTNLVEDINSVMAFERYFFNVIVRGEEKRGVLKWGCGRATYQAIICGICGNPKNTTLPKLGDVTHPMTGYDFHISQPTQAKQGFIDYLGSQFLPSTKMGTPRQVKMWASQLHDLSQIRQVQPKSEMMNALEGIFGYLGSVRPGQIYRSVMDPFEPEW